MGIFNIFMNKSDLEVNVQDLDEINEKFYSDGILFTGIINSYNNGIKLETVKCKRGEIVSPLIHYYETGDIEFVKKFDQKGYISEIGFYQNGIIRYEILYQKRRKIKRTDYHPSGKIKNIKPYIYVERYNGDVPHGLEINFDEDGNKISESIWAYGLPDGTYNY